MKKNKTRYICDFEGCRHRNEENVCCLFNQENCVYYRTLQALNGYKENAKWCDDCKNIKELEQKNHAMLVNSLKICNQSEIDNDENERKIAELEEKNKWYSEQVCYKECAEEWGKLTKAKEIIKKLLHSLKNEGSDYTFALENTHPVLTEAEQFIKENK